MSKGTGRPEKKKAGVWVLLSVLTLLNLLLSVFLRIYDRKLALAAVREDETLRLLYSGEKTTKTV